MGSLPRHEPMTRSRSRFPTACGADYVWRGEWRSQVDGQDHVPIGIIEIGNGIEGHHRGIVDKIVDLPPNSDDFLNYRLDVCGIGDVRGYEARSAVPLAFRQRLEVFLDLPPFLPISPRHEDVGAFSCEAISSGSADSRR